MRRFPIYGLLSSSSLASAAMSAGRLPAFAVRGHNHIGAFTTLQQSSQSLKWKKINSVTLATIPHRPFRSSSLAERFFSKLSRLHSVNLSDETCEGSVVSISDTYDGGNGEFVSSEIAPVGADYDEIVRVNIRPDPFTDLEQKQHFQSFSFRATSKSCNRRVKYIVSNAGRASYAPAWNGSAIFVTGKPTPFDPDSWTRTEDTIYDEEKGELSWTHSHESHGDDNGASSAYFSYFPPYSYERHLRLVAKCAEAKGCKVTTLGQTISGREIDCVSIGTGNKLCWIIHRQHPGESMAEFYAEGLIHRLLGLDTNGALDEVAKHAREEFTFHIIPNMNPDGSVNGYLRTNAAGSNLNREWAPSLAPTTTTDKSEDANEKLTMYEAPTVERSPEVYHVLRKMDETGCDAFLDVHGDEALPFNFLAGSQGMPNWGKRLESLHGAILAAYERANPDMQKEVSYDPDEPNEGMKNICSNQIALRFDCLSATLEMPFKEVWGRERGWGPDRARKLGASVLDALCYVSPYLRNEGNFWEQLPEEDAYVNPSSKY